MEFVETGLNRISYGDYGTKYPVVYKVSEDKKSFEIRVRHNIDAFLTIKGGVENEIEETVTFARESPYPDENELCSNVFKS